MAIVGRGKIRFYCKTMYRATGRVVITGLLLCLASILPAIGQHRPTFLSQINLAEQAFNDGDYAKAVGLAESALKWNSVVDSGRISALDLIARSQIAQAKYPEAKGTLKRSLDLISSAKLSQRQEAQTYLRLADLARSQRDFPKALREAKKGLEVAPHDKQVQGEFYLGVGRIMFSAGYDLSAIVWLEKAERIFASEPDSTGQLDVYRFLSLAWSSKLNYPAALKCSEEFISSSAGSRFKHRHRQALFESATLLDSIGQKHKALSMREKGLRLSLESKNDYQARNFLSSLLLSSLYDGDTQSASRFLEQLKKIDPGGEFSFETQLATAIILALAGRSEESETLFAELEKRENISPFILPSWKVTIAEKNKQWEQVLRHGRTLLELNVAQNFRDDLPRIYLAFATAYFNLGQVGESIEYLDKALALIEELRAVENTNLSLGLLETYHAAYRLLTQINLKRPLEAFELADYLKARLLKDKINNSQTTVKSVITPELRQKLENRSLEMFDDKNVAEEISKLESSFTTFVPQLPLDKPRLSQLDRIPDLDDKAIVSYLFTVDQRLVAFVWEKGTPVRSVSLPVSEPDLEAEVMQTEQKIQNRIFFKRDGKGLYDKLLEPLDVSAQHLIIVPDKYLWKIPFQALSPDGERYLIENKLISYAPSVSILLEQLKAPKPARRTIQVFANPLFDNQFLQYVNREATTVAGLFGTRPVLNATTTDFRQRSDKADITHFSMHAQVNNDDPMNSFLGFKRAGGNNGRLTVEDILRSRLKQGSLVFLASCDTNRVLSGEGLVSLAWGMMGAGATTVISAQWEANDKLTSVFSKAFYNHFRQGYSSAEALQRASLEIIRNKSSNMHEPYYWADFSVNGDFR